jgi:transposase
MPRKNDEEVQRLKDENTRLHQSLTALEAQLKLSNQTNADLQKLLTSLQEKLDILIVQYKKRNRREFGSKNERHNPRQGEPAPSPKKPTQEKSSNPTTREKHILSQNLPNETVSHSVKPEFTNCPDCAVATKFVTNEITHQLERLTHTVKRLQHEQEVRACPKCKKYIVTAEKPCPPIPGSYAGPGLLADIVVSKLADALPNYRQQRRFAREDAIIPRSTQCDWILAISLTVQPLVDLIKAEILLSHIVQTDDSELKVQDRQHKRNMRKGKMSVYRGDWRHPYTLFDFSPTQSFARNIAFFKDYKETIQADAAPGFDALFRDGTRTEAGCNAHSRRKYYDLLVIETFVCNDILDVYHKLYLIEEQIRNASMDIRLAMRRRFSKPLAKELRMKLVALRKSLNPTHPLMQAIEYTLGHWIALTRFLKDPELDIDNNASEREIKDFVLDRKNFLFVGSDAGGTAMATLLTLVASAKRNKVDPRKYLTDVFSRINSMKTSELEQLLPDRWKQNQN